MSDFSCYIRTYFEERANSEYSSFSAKLIPNIEPDSILGVRIPIIRAFAKEIKNNENIGSFFREVPHKYHEENILHAILINNIKTPDDALSEIEKFLPYITNWAVSDTLSPKCLNTNTRAHKEVFNKWINSKANYSIRVGVLFYMKFCLCDEFDTKDLKIVSKIKSNEYYVNMMRAWYFATALAFQYDRTIELFENKILDTFTHNKSIQKAIESYRVTNEHKAYLRTLKIK